MSLLMDILLVVQVISRGRRIVISPEIRKEYDEHRRTDRECCRSQLGEIHSGDEASLMQLGDLERLDGMADRLFRSGPSIRC
jgi:hypothetical protein